MISIIIILFPILFVFAKAVEEGNDGVVYENIVDPILSTSYGIFEPEQIHILGNKQDIEGFKEFVSTQPPTDNLNAPDGLPGIPRTSTDCQ